jgi:phenylalanyl-tRNA synthetase beta chain
LIIADASGPVAVAGVMGLLNSEVGVDTREILLESAFFHPLLIRQAARDLGLMTESSYRFEREADWDMVLFAAQRALYLLNKYASAHIVEDWSDRQNPDRGESPGIPLRISQANRLLGTDLETTDAVQLLQQLSLKVVPLGGGSDRKSGAANLMVKVPAFRRDLKEEVDLIEEIARLYGYDRITGTGRVQSGIAGARRSADRDVQILRNYLASCGFYEISTSSFWGEEARASLHLPAGDPRLECLKIANPHHGGDTLLRTSLLPAFLTAARHNINADNPLPLRMFEINKVFQPATARRPEGPHTDESLLPAEPQLLQLGVVARTERGLGDLPVALLEIKGLVENLARLLRLFVRLVPDDQEPFLAAGQQWRLEDEEGKTLGTAGTVKPSVARQLEVELPVVVAEIDLNRRVSEPAAVVFQPFARFPAAKRDLSLLVPESVTYASLCEVLRESGGELLESMELFDFYRGSELPKSVAAIGIRLKFRSLKGNLKGKTVDKAIARITAALSEQCHVHLRS